MSDDTEESKKDKAFTHLMREQSEILENYGKKADKLMQSIQNNFEKDYSSFCVGAGGLAVIASVGLVVLDKSISFSIMLSVLGFALLIAGVVLRVISAKIRLECLPKILELEKDIAQIQFKQKISYRYWLGEKPHKLDEDKFRLLLGLDIKSAPKDDEEPRLLTSEE
ncbi:hypothetical protein [Denitrificimonas caeni]|uniref:hypothetical protein n=1 Tax=Denitrificimonas caeni TaxID=521720 RepID=UPI0003B47285|nr:hypothetical protein [Denitrificimonas caeni]